jgi:DNA-binding transcriptional ArsR family regulator
MSKRKPKQKQPKADLVALGESFANLATTAQDHLAYWWNQLHPNRQPVTVGIQIVDATVLPLTSKDVPPTPDELRQYFVARLGYSLPDYEAMTVAEVVDVLRREAGQQTRATPELSETLANILEALGRDELNGREIADVAGYTYDTTRKHLSTLKDRGLIQKTKRGYRRV